MFLAMNLLDLIIIAIIGFSIFSGMSKGFTLTVLRLVAFVASALVAYIFYPVVARLLGSTVLSTLGIYVEGNEYVNDVMLANQPITALSPDSINAAIQNANLPAPFSSALHSNISNQALANQNASTLGDYFDATLANVLLGIIAFLIIFLLVRLILGIVIRATDSVTRLPVLKQFNSLLGGALGLVRGVLFIFALFMLVPILTLILPADTVMPYINGSLLAPFFSNANLLLSFIGGVL